MSQFARTLSLALVAAALLPGCARVAGPVAMPPVMKPATKAGTVKVSFPGLKPAAAVFKTLATRADIATVEVTLTDARNRRQVQRLDRAALWLPMVEASFKAVAAGPAMFEVAAYDEQGAEIGRAATSDVVRSNQTTVMQLSVKLAPETGSGHVAALIDFIDGDPAPVCGSDAFHRADQNGDGQLDTGEYLGGYPFALCDVPVVKPVPMPMPVLLPEATASSDGYRLACAPYPGPPELHPAMREFEARDLDRNGLLSLDEFLGIAPPPVDPCEESFKALDADGDGRLSFKEWSIGRPVPMIGAPESSLPFWRKSPLRKEFEALDVDGDFKLDLDEHCGRIVRAFGVTTVTAPAAAAQ
jgi:hypothetical protein